MKEQLINKDHPLDEFYVPEDLVFSDNNENNFHNYVDPKQKPCVTREVYTAFCSLQEDALHEGIHIIIDSGYRSFDYQKQIWDYTVMIKGLEHAQKYVALPGTSEHQSGLAIDIAVMKDGIYSDDITEVSNAYLWMKNNAHYYGFILRYPKGKESITGYNHEPWHFRYVGVYLANKLYKEDITLEEYYLKEKHVLKRNKRQ